MKNRKKLWTIITIIWVLVIWTFSLQPGNVSGDLSGSLITKIMQILAPGILNNPEQLEMWHSVFRKCAHFTEYLILGIFCRNATSYMKTKWQNIAAILFCIAVASIDETIQLFVSGRAGRVTDVLIDSVGAMTGIVLILTFVKKLLKKNN